MINICKNCVYLGDIGIDGEDTGKCFKDKSQTVVDFDMGFQCFQEDNFEELAKPLIRYINKHHHPHARIIIATDNAEIVEGLKAFSTDEFILD
jgi:uncharacterized membrane protein affecting hemolysin expression